ncbi:hypothetical protein [Arthrospira platensis]|uniref:hypothetical protein n=1 Tax=Limnospira platensis TaxID=118562 RepID=UPI000AB2DAB0
MGSRHPGLTKNSSPVKHFPEANRLNCSLEKLSQPPRTPTGNRYAYLYRGQKQVGYLAGPHLSEKAKAIADQVEQWIESGLSLEAILEKLPALKSGGWKSPDSNS